MNNRHRTTATMLAMERDEYKCLYCLVVHERFRLGVHGHHIFRPRSLYDKPEYIITLCVECHMAHVHTGGKVNAKELVEKVMIPYVWGGVDLTPIGK